MIGYLLRRQAEVPDGVGWLTPAERRWFNDRRSAKRVADWRLGRWTAKAAIAAWLELQARPAGRKVEILAAADGAPEALAGGQPLPLTLSISHSHGRAVAAVAAAGVALGCDIERIEHRSPAFLDSYLTDSERAALAAADVASRDLHANLFWSAKESALKALRRGLTVDARTLEVVAGLLDGTGWGRLEVRAEPEVLTGHWARLGDLVLTIASRPGAERIVELG